MQESIEKPIPKSFNSKLFSPALKTAGSVGSVGGFVGDVLSPLGNVIEGLLLISITIMIVSFIFGFFKKGKRELFKKVSLNSSFFSAVFGIFLLLNQGTNAGFLGDNFEPIAKLQQSLNLISDQLNELEEEGARLRDLELVNKLNLITGFLHFSDRFNKEMVNDIVSLYNEFDMKYKIKTGWDMSVKEMITEDVTSLYEEGIITKTTHELVLKTL